jgi:hypothetical protein
MSGWESWEDAANRGPSAIAWKVGVFVVVLAIIVSVGGFVIYPLAQGRRVIEKTLDADNMIYNYEWFKQRNQDISAIESKIRSAKAAVDLFKSEAGPRKDWKRDDREESSRLSVILLGLRQQRADLAAEYNARSAMANRSIFRTGELPERIPVE